MADRVSDPSRTLLVAGKEFADHLASRRFTLVLLLFLILCSVSLYEGVENYSEKLAAYSDGTAPVPKFLGYPPGWMPEKPPSSRSSSTSPRWSRVTARCLRSRPGST